MQLARRPLAHGLARLGGTLALWAAGLVASVCAQQPSRLPIAWSTVRSPLRAGNGLVPVRYQAPAFAREAEVAPSQMLPNEALVEGRDEVVLGAPPPFSSAVDEQPVAVVPDPTVVLDPMAPIVIAPEVELDTGDFYDDHPIWLRNLSLSAGMQGFRGPSDFTGVGNFGFNESINWGVPLLPYWNIGGQLGVRGVHSNFGGDTSRFDPQGFHSGRDQVFATAAFFTRAVDGGWQSGSAFDYFHDTAYSNFDLTQARIEYAYNIRGRAEIGFWGAYGANSQTVTYTILQRLVTKLEPTDIYTLFYRHHFTGGGQGRLWAGMTGDGAAIFGGEATVPLGTQWALQNNFTYRLAHPNRPPGEGDESWAVSLRLVWYPWQTARNVFRDPYHPLFDVADNSVFLIDRGPTTVAP